MTTFAAKPVQEILKQGAKRKQEIILQIRMNFRTDPGITAPPAVVFLLQRYM
jgi:hypothetical protein